MSANRPGNGREGPLAQKAERCSRLMACLGRKYSVRVSPPHSCRKTLQGHQEMSRQCQYRTSGLRLGRRHRRPSDPHPSCRNSGRTPRRAPRWQFPRPERVDRSGSCSSSHSFQVVFRVRNCAVFPVTWAALRVMCMPQRTARSFTLH